MTAANDIQDPDGLVAVFTPCLGRMCFRYSDNILTNLWGFTLEWRYCVVRQFQSAASASSEAQRLGSLLSRNSRTHRQPTLDSLSGWYRPGWSRKKRRSYDATPLHRTVLISSTFSKSDGKIWPFMASVVGHPTPSNELTTESHLIFEMIPSWPPPKNYDISSFPVFEYLQARSIG